MTLSYYRLDHGLRHIVEQEIVLIQQSTFEQLDLLAGLLSETFNVALEHIELALVDLVGNGLGLAHVVDHRLELPLVEQLLGSWLNIKLGVEWSIFGGHIAQIGIQDLMRFFFLLRLVFGEVSGLVACQREVTRAVHEISGRKHFVLQLSRELLILRSITLI